MITNERASILWYALERAEAMPREFKGLVKAWTFGGAGPVEAHLMATWTYFNWTVKLCMCLAFGHVRENRWSDEDPQTHCERCGSSIQAQEDLS